MRPTDAIAPYRLSMAVNLPGVGPLASAWKPELRTVLPQTARRGVVVDCRSSTYAAAWTPEGELADRWVQVRVPGATHMAKHTRGLVARHLCRDGAGLRGPCRRWRRCVGAAFDVSLHEPARRRDSPGSSTSRPAERGGVGEAGVNGAELADLLTRVGPVLVFFVAITVVAEIADAAGVFDVAGHWAARAGRHRTLVLWLLFVALAVGVHHRAVSLDTTAVLLTPVGLAIAAQLDISPVPFAL